MIRAIYIAVFIMFFPIAKNSSGQEQLNLYSEFFADFSYTEDQTIQMQKETYSEYVSFHPGWYTMQFPATLFILQSQAIADSSIKNPETNTLFEGYEKLQSSMNLGGRANYQKLLKYDALYKKYPWADPNTLLFKLYLSGQMRIKDRNDKVVEWTKLVVKRKKKFALYQVLAPNGMVIVKFKYTFTKTSK